MFLLIRRAVINAFFDSPPFTFHNVSINTDINSISTLISNIFTFHNVSINTVLHTMIAVVLYTNLHSTMFLLIHFRRSQPVICTRIYIPQCFY